MRQEVLLDGPLVPTGLFLCSYTFGWEWEIWGICYFQGDGTHFFSVYFFVIDQKFSLCLWLCQKYLDGHHGRRGTWLARPPLMQFGRSPSACAFMGGDGPSRLALVSHRSSCAPTKISMNMTVLPDFHSRLNLDLSANKMKPDHRIRAESVSKS